ncbi:hydrophobic surface binding protein [Mycena latifolia]|nr:hydrophobic surface binding protein [Mycena latifolia]
MVQIARLCFFLSAVSIGFALSVKRDAATVEGDINAINGLVVSLDNSIKAYPDNGGSLLGALGVHSGAGNIVNKLNSATTDATNAGNFGEADARTLVNLVRNLEPAIVAALRDIVAKKPAFAKLPIGGIPGLICGDLEKLRDATIAFATALIKKLPGDQTQATTALKTTITNDFIPGIAAYC